MDSSRFILLHVDLFVKTLECIMCDRGLIQSVWADVLNSDSKKSGSFVPNAFYGEKSYGQ